MNMDKSTKLIQDLLDFISEVDSCASCVPPREAYDSGYNLRWNLLLKRMREAVSKANLPN